VVHCPEQIDWLAAHKTERAQRVFLKMNSGMNRLGFGPEALRAAWARLNALPQVDEITLVTHFADADGERGIAHQVEVFEAATRDLPGERSLANSAALLRHGARAVNADWVRAGIMSYGSSPDFPRHDIRHWQLQPTMTLRSRLIAVQRLRAGDRVGYGGSYEAPGPMRIGIVACGYADGYPRHCGTDTPVLVDGVVTGTVGRVSMDMMAVDLTPLPDAGPGSEVTLWGRGPGASMLPIDDVARAAGTIGYELMCALASRVPVRAID
jgi:alanine racemase